MKNDDEIKWVEEDKEAGIKGGYITLIPSPKTKKEKNANSVDAVDAVDSVDTIDAVDVYGNQERLRSVYGIDGQLDEPVEPSEGIKTGGASTASTVSTQNNEPLPISLMQEFRDTYLKLQQADPEKLAPLGTVQWFVPESDLPTGQISRKEYSIRLQSLYGSNEVRKIQAGLEEMQRKLGQVN
jgi:hypothetical protein